MSTRAVAVPIVRHGEGRADTDQDLVAVEAPVTIRLSQPGRADRWPLGVLMRTPGDDEDLVCGLLLSEGLIREAGDVLAIVSGSGDQASVTGDPALGTRDEETIDVSLDARLDLAATFAGRATISSSACGLCGRLETMRLVASMPRTPDAPTWTAALIASLPGRLVARQAVFAQTGGLHAAGLFEATGTLILAREDVGRHNAVDKAVGAAARGGLRPGPGTLLAVSGRAAYEIVQKASAAGVAGLVAVGAPSSLAVHAARAAGLTLAGFTRDGRFNVYAGHRRVR